MADIIYLNGKFMPLAEASVSVLDRGFLFGDGVYEVISVYGGKLFLADEHLQRLQHSLDSIDIANPHPNAEWKAKLEQIVAHNGIDRPVYLQVTRGVDKTRKHYYENNLQPTVFIMSLDPVEFGKSRRSPGVKLKSAPDERWKHCHIKSINLLTNILAYKQGKTDGAEDTVLVRDGVVTECSTSNIFAVIDGRIKTPLANGNILNGITRQLILNLAQQQGIPYEECQFSLDELCQADEVWISSSTREILPVTQIDQLMIADGKPGPVWQKINQEFINYALAVSSNNEQQ